MGERKPILWASCQVLAKALHFTKGDTSKCPCLLLAGESEYSPVSPVLHLYSDPWKMNNHSSHYLTDYFVDFFPTVTGFAGLK